MADGDEDVERLRRVAYGPGAGAAERAEAEAALQALEGRRPDAGVPVDAAPVADVEVLASLESNELEGGDAHGGDGGEAVTPIWQRRIQVGWVVPIVAVAIAVGAVGALQVTGQVGPTSPVEGPTTISPTAPPSEGSNQVPGDLEAADAWFDGPATASDAYPFAGFLEANDIDRYEVRFALAGGGGWNVWVGRSGTDELCLLIAGAADQSGAAGCVERGQFAREGVHLGLGEHTAHWFGGDVMTGSPSTSPGDPNSIPSVPGAGPGSLEGASAWFERPAEASDAFPLPPLLASLGIEDQQVRLVASGDQFLAFGVSLATPGQSVYWGGDNVSATG